jgi:hypothetical protein
MIIDSMPSNDFPHAHNGTRNKSYAVILRVVVNVRLRVDLSTLHHTDKKENQNFLIYKEIQSGAVAKSYMRKGFLIYEEMGKYFPIYEEAVSHI